MKYYPSREEAKDYILNYTIMNDKILIKYANRKISEIPYSKTEESSPTLKRAIDNTQK